MAQRDYRKYKRLYKPDREQREKTHNVDDLLAIQQIELDRGNYNRPDEVIVFGDHRQLQPKRSEQPNQQKPRNSPRKKGNHEKSKRTQQNRKTRPSNEKQYIRPSRAAVQEPGKIIIDNYKY